MKTTKRIIKESWWKDVVLVREEPITIYYYYFHLFDSSWFFRGRSLCLFVHIYLSMHYICTVVFWIAAVRQVSLQGTSKSSGIVNNHWEFLIRAGSENINYLFIRAFLLKHNSDNNALVCSDRGFLAACFSVNIWLPPPDKQGNMFPWCLLWPLWRSLELVWDRKIDNAHCFKCFL